MPTAWIETPGAVVRLQSERLEIQLPACQNPSTTPVNIPLAEIEHLVVAEDVRLTFPALCAAMRRGIPVLIHDWRGQILGTVVPPASPHALLRLQQYDRARDSDFSATLARTLIQSKIRNQRRLLNRLNAARPIPQINPLSDRMAAILTALDCTVGISALMGFEGTASALYWSGWAAFLPADFPFTKRSTRPPLNPVNAVLSYLSAILYGEVLAACHRRGLDPGLGHLHVTANGRWSLALDLMEPFRSAVVEAVTLRLFSHRMLKMHDFAPHDGGVYLAASGKKLVIEQFEKRVSRPFQSEHAGHRTTLRQQIEATALSYRLALEDAALFRPFIMN